MADLEYWDTINGIGELYIENELVVGAETLLFVCVDAKRSKRWLFMTYDSCEGIYVFVRTDAWKLLKMLQNKITMEETFRNAAYISETYLLESGDMAFRQEKSSAFDEKRLPNKGAYYNISSKYICDYIEMLKKESYPIYVDYKYSGNMNIHFGLFDRLTEYCVQLEESGWCVIEMFDGNGYGGNADYRQEERYIEYMYLFEELMEEYNVMMAA